MRSLSVIGRLIRDGWLIVGLSLLLFCLLEGGAQLALRRRGGSATTGRPPSIRGPRLTPTPTPRWPTPTFGNTPARRRSLGAVRVLAEETLPGDVHQRGHQRPAGHSRTRTARDAGHPAPQDLHVRRLDDVGHRCSRCLRHSRAGRQRPAARRRERRRHQLRRDRLRQHTESHRVDAGAASGRAPDVPASSMMASTTRTPHTRSSSLGLPNNEWNRVAEFNMSPGPSDGLRSQAIAREVVDRLATDDADARPPGGTGRGRLRSDSHPDRTRSPGRWWPRISAIWSCCGR